MIEPDFPAKLVFPRWWRLTSVAISLIVFVAFAVGAFEAAHLV